LIASWLFVLLIVAVVDLETVGWVDAGNDGKNDQNAETVELEGRDLPPGGDKTAVYDGSCYQYDIERFHGVVVNFKTKIGFLLQNS